MKALITCIMLAVSLPALAQYKCTEGGKTVYSDQPCGRDARHVGAPQDRVTADQQLQRMEQNLKERRERNSIEYREAVDDAAKARAGQARRNQEAADAAAQKRRCDSLQRDITNNERAIARYQDFAWRNQRAQHEAELQRNRDAYDRECKESKPPAMSSSSP